ncbi:hypothetical protein Cgig2_000821 [Carnegiea gigantea]|uniref:DUF4283 domain-containing protein n=1 Tax=Carnegiea gigantea TaxID=171969 RepID=A0A9Q1KKW5_9CARY|nr:hypothetical protein Cgig2_000821 [Carnegiea gigantea]
METNSHPLNLVLAQPPHSVSRSGRAYPLSPPAQNAQIVGSITTETSTLAAPILSGATQPSIAQNTQNVHSQGLASGTCRTTSMAARAAKPSRAPESAQLLDKLQVEKWGFYFFDSKPMLVKGWNPNMDLQTETIRSLPLWIQLPSLDIKYWGIESLSKNGSLLGVPIKTDKITKEKQAIRYARLLVEMPIEGPFPDHVDFFNEEGVLIRQQVTYEWVPSKCTHCAMLGHTEEVCKKKKGVVRKEWRKKTQPSLLTSLVAGQPAPSTTPSPPQLETSTSLEPPPRRLHPAPKRPSVTPVAPLSELHNSFEALSEAHILVMQQDILHKENQSTDPPHELTNFLLNCEVQELSSSGAFFTRTNKTIWSKLDRVFINNLWYEIFDFTLAKVLPSGLSNHSPILLQFHVPPRPPSYFQFCDMWSSHRDFRSIVSVSLPDTSSQDILRLTRVYFSQVRRQLSQLNRVHFKDLKIQQELARNALLQLQHALQCSPDNVGLKHLENEARANYISILSSSLALLRQQCKMDWISYGDDSTRFFFTKAKQRKLTTYIYSIHDAFDNEIFSDKV